MDRRGVPRDRVVERHDVRVIECDGCGFAYDGTRYRWLCPQCHLKSSCCEGAALPICERPA